MPGGRRIQQEVQLTQHTRQITLLLVHFYTSAHAGGAPSEIDVDPVLKEAAEVAWVHLAGIVLREPLAVVRRIAGLGRYSALLSLHLQS